MPLAARWPPPGAGTARRGGDVAPSSPHPLSPITSGALNSCRSPGCLSPGPPGCRVTAHGAAGRHPPHSAPRGCRQSRAAGSRCMHPPPPPAPCTHCGTWGTPRLGVLCVHSMRLRAGSSAPGIGASHQRCPSPTPWLIRRARSLCGTVGMLMLRSPGKSPALAPKMRSVVYPHVVPRRSHRHMGINNLDLFPRGVQQGLIH